MSFETPSDGNLSADDDPRQERPEETDHEHVSELDAITILTDVLTRRDEYEAAIIKLATHKTVDLEKVHLEAPENLGPHLKNASVTHGEMTVDINATKNIGSPLALGRVAIMSLDGPKIIFQPLSDELMFVSNPYGSSGVTAKSELKAALFPNAANDKQLWQSIFNARNQSERHNSYHSFEQYVGDALLSGSVREIEESEQSIIMFEFALQRAHPSGKYAGTTFTIIESSDKTMLSIDNIDPNAEVSTLIGRKRMIEEIMSIADIIGDETIQIPVKKYTKTQIADMHEALHLVRQLAATA